MASGGPLAFTDVPSPPLPAQQPVQGGGKLLSFRGQPYWRDTSGILWALTATGANAVPWSESGFTGGAAPPGGTTDFLCADGTWQVPAGADSASFSAAADGQGNNGVVVTENPAINSMASGVQASAILAGGITGSPNAISGVVNYSLIDGGYDDVIESTSVGVLKIGGAHNRIFGNSASHSAIHWGSFHVLENGSYAVISGGTGHTVASDGAVIAGGESNTIPPSSQEAAVGGGSANVAYGAFSTVAGGTAGYTGANEATVSGGSANENFGQYGVTAGPRARTANTRADPGRPEPGAPLRPARCAGRRPDAGARPGARRASPPWARGRSQRRPPVPPPAGRAPALTAGLTDESPAARARRASPAC